MMLLLIGSNVRNNRKRMHNIHVNVIISVVREWYAVNNFEALFSSVDNLRSFKSSNRHLSYLKVIVSYFKVTINDQSSIWNCDMNQRFSSQTSILLVWIWTLYDQLTVNFPKQTTNALRIFDMGTYMDVRFAAS